MQLTVVYEMESLCMDEFSRAKSTCLAVRYCLIVVGIPVTNESTLQKQNFPSVNVPKVSDSVHGIVYRIPTLPSIIHIQLMLVALYVMVSWLIL